MLGEVSGAMLQRGMYSGPIAVQGPAHPYVTEFERSGEAATHLSEI
jgi:hypothetical protein